VKAVSFDFGQTLAELDFDFLQRRLQERGAAFDPHAAAAKSPLAWEIYGAKKSEGHAAAWRGMIEAQLAGGDVPAERVAELGAWLWDEQPRRNLWRKPIAGMIELVGELKRASVPIAIISNSEGYLAELIDELGWTSAFDVVVDSGRVGIDKPDPRIFAHACTALGVETQQLLHVGDAWQADVQGALGAAASAVWFDLAHGARSLPPRVYGAGNAVQLREVLARLGFLS
jgi:HAD superfamily hydrolase (TIGR01509 family)